MEVAIQERNCLSASEIATTIVVLDAHTLDDEYSLLEGVGVHN